MAGRYENKRNTDHNVNRKVKLLNPGYISSQGYDGAYDNKVGDHVYNVK
jgi:hypothetical protein